MIDKGYFVAVTGITWIWERRSTATVGKGYPTAHQ